MQKVRKREVRQVAPLVAVGEFVADARAVQVDERNLVPAGARVAEEDVLVAKVAVHDAGVVHLAHRGRHGLHEVENPAVVAAAAPAACCCEIRRRPPSA